MIRKFQLDEIEFDFEMEDDEYPSAEYQQQVTETALKTVYEIDCDSDADEDEIGDLLLDEISNQSGWCVFSSSYHEVFQ